MKLMKNDPPPSCAEVGSVSGYTVGPNYEERLKNKLRNDAADKGANYVRLVLLIPRTFPFSATCAIRS